jgi:hypothetical protein
VARPPIKPRVPGVRPPPVPPSKTPTPPPPPRAPPPAVPSPAGDEIARFKRKLFAIYHAVEEKDWDRLSDPMFVEILNDIEREAVELEKKDLLRLRYFTAKEQMDRLRFAIKERNAFDALREIAEFLFGLPPHI